MSLFNKYALIWFAVIFALVFGFDISCSKNAIYPHECGIVTLMLIVTLTFPSGFLFILGLNLLLATLSSLGISYDDSKMFGIAIPVIGAAIIGYYQWFVIIPKVWKYLKMRVKRVNRSE